MLQANIINTTPNEIKMMKTNGRVVTYPVMDDFFLRQAPYERTDAVRETDGIPVYASSANAVEVVGKGFRNQPPFQDALNYNQVTLIVTLEVAKNARELRMILGAPNMRIIVPDSLSSIRVPGEDFDLDEISVRTRFIDF